MNLRYANSFGNITKCVPAIAFNYFPVFETFAFPVTCTGRQYFFRTAPDRNFLLSLQRYLIRAMNIPI